MTIRTPLAIATAAVLLASSAALGERIVTVDVSRSLGPLNRELGGVTQGSANPAVNQALAAVDIPHIRIDAWFDLGGVDCVNPPDFTALDARVANVRAAGAEPLVIIDYMPACMSRYTGPRFGGQPDPKRHPPADYAEWEALVYATVRHLVRDLGVRWFEAWNEPDLPQFFQGTLVEYLEIFDAIERAVRRVEVEESTSLRLGGPAVAFPDP
ncbi:MAG: GH39 family glycosyl hydrolase, partial [Candidatus Binatia bacterium]